MYVLTISRVAAGVGEDRGFTVLAAERGGMPTGERDRETREGEHPRMPGFTQQYVTYATEAVESASDDDGQHGGWVRTQRVAAEFPAESRFHDNHRVLADLLRATAGRGHIERATTTTDDGRPVEVWRPRGLALFG